MIKQKHYFVEFYLPGSFFTETSGVEVKSWDEAFTVPKWAFGIKLIERIDCTDDAGDVFRGNEKALTGIIYHGEVWDLEHVTKLAAEDPTKYGILRDNMEINKFPFVVSVYGRSFPVRDEDIVVAEEFPEHMTVKWLKGQKKTYGSLFAMKKLIDIGTTEDVRVVKKAKKGKAIDGPEVASAYEGVKI